MAEMDELTALDAFVLQEFLSDDIGDHFIHSQTSIMEGMAIAAGGAATFVNGSTEESCRVEGYVEHIIPLYSAVDFKSHFRMERATFEELCKKMAPAMRGDRSVSVEKKVLSTLWLLGNQESYRDVADRFGESKGSLHRTVLSVCQLLCAKMDEIIQFPETRLQMEAVAEGFRQRCGFPGVVGAVDGTHVPIPAPTSIHRASYINRKGYASMVLQVICDSRLKFLDIYTGWPGSVHDARVYRNSPVAAIVDSKVPQDFHLLGDSAYPLSNNLLVPFRDNGHLGEVEKKYNTCHSSTRVDVERAIGLLKCKFRRLKYLDMKLEAEIPTVIGSCCVLHNFILDHDSIDFDGVQIEEETHDVTGNERKDGTQKRWRIAESL